LWLWHSPAAVALIQALAWKFPYAVGAAQEMAKRQKKKKKKEKKRKEKKSYSSQRVKILEIQLSNVTEVEIA